MALLRSDSNDEKLESILHAFISKDSLSTIRRYIPETILVGKKGEGLEQVNNRISIRKYVLKEAISSGMKGVFFSDNQDFQSILKLAYNSNMNWVLQEEVENQPQSFSWYEDNCDDESISNDWFVRVTTHYVNRKLADIIVTARRDRSVHGAKDCLQIGTVIV